MKMSEVFNLPLKVVEPAIQDGGGWPVISASVEGESVCGHMGKFEIKKGPHSGTSRYLDVELAEKMASSAAYAINNHDRLEQEAAELREALEGSVNLLSHTEEYCEGLLGDYEDHELVGLGKKLVQQRNSIKQLLNK